MKKTAKQMERHFKGVANHHRIEILLAVSQNSGMSVEGIATMLNANFKTISQHTNSLVRAGLLNKKYEGRVVRHLLSPYGKLLVSFIKKFQLIK